jgi:hypothetical protein
MRMDPPVSEPKEARPIPRATATALPPLLPPAWRVGSTAFLTGPVQGFSPVMPRATSCMLVLAKMRAPASLSRPTAKASSGRGGRGARVPARVGIPFTGKRSLTVRGRP